VDHDVPLDASTTFEEEVVAALEAKQLGRPGLTIFTDGSRLENGATGHAVTWKKGLTWEGHKTHMGWGQEAFDAECAAIATPSKRRPPGATQSEQSPSSRMRKRPSGE